MVALVGCAFGASPSRTRRKVDDEHDRYSSKDPEERKAHRLEKYDRLLEMAENAKVDMPNLRREVEALKVC